MNAHLMLVAALALLAPQKDNVKVFVDAKPKQSISGERTFRVTVQSKNPVNYVEFYVGKEFKTKDTSTPYQFTLDTLDEKEGPLKLTFKAYTTEGDSGQADLDVVVDNGLSKGVDAHLQAGKDAMAGSNWAKAIDEGRIALKVDPNSNAARVLLARAYLGSNDFGRAQKYAQDVLDKDPKNADALNLMAGVNLKIAFGTYVNSGGDRKEAVSTISDAYKSAVEARRKVLDEEVDAAGSPTGANVVPYVDAALHAGRYSLALPILKDAITKNGSDTKLFDRLMYVYLRTGRYRDAFQAAADYKRAGGLLDAYGTAAMAIVYAELGDPDTTDKLIADALVSDPDEPAVAAAQAYIALKFIRPPVAATKQYNLNYDDANASGSSAAAARAAANTALSRILAEVSKSHGQNTVTSYYAGALDNKLSDFGAGRRSFQDAVLMEPANADAYIEEANRALTATQMSNLDKDEREHELSTAETLYNTALLARPDSAQALTGLALVATIRANFADAIRWGEAAVAANPDYAAGYLSLGTAYNLGSSVLRTQADSARQKARAAGTSPADRQALELQARNLETQALQYQTSARTAGLKAGSLDPRLQGQLLEKPYAAWRYFRAGGRVPVLPQPR